MDGAGAYAWTSDPDPTANLDGFSELTLAAWVNPDVSAEQMVVSKYNSQFGLPSYYLILRGPEVEIGIAGPGGWFEMTSTGANIQTGSWTHVAGTWRSGSVTLYVDGVQVLWGSYGSPAVLRDNSTPVDIGALEAISNGTRPYYFDGLIDEVYIFDRVLAAAEIAELASGLTR